MSLISSIVEKLVNLAAPRIVDQVLPENPPKNFNEGWRKVVSYTLGASVGVFFGIYLLIVAANAVGTIFGHPIPHYAEFMALMGNVSTGDLITISLAMLGWGSINVAYNHKVNKLMVENKE